jgi:hypothetical protein
LEEIRIADKEKTYQEFYVVLQYLKEYVDILVEK